VDTAVGIGHSALVAPSLVRSFGVLATALLLTSCGDEPDEMASFGSAGMETTAASSSSVSSTESWRWQGLVIGPLDAAPRACLGALMASDPPQCTGWPLSGFDWSAVPWSKANPVSRIAEVQLVGHPQGKVFVLDELPLAPDRHWTPPPCEFLDGRAGDSISAIEAFTLIETGEAARAGVWVEPGLSGLGGDLAVSGDVSLGLVFSNDASYAWLIDNFPGLRIQVCPQMRLVNEPWLSADEPNSSSTTARAATTIPTPGVPLQSGPVDDPTASVASSATTTSTAP